MMKNRTRNILAGIALVAVVIVTTIVTQLVLFGPNHQAAKTTEASQVAQAEKVEQGNIPGWSEADTYVAGNQVTFEGKIYEAKWWTKGEKPTASNEWGVWKVVAVAGSSGGSDNSPSRVGETGFKVVGYYPDWQPDKINQIQYDKLTHINYAFAIPREDGGLRPLDNPQAARDIIAKAHANNVKVLLAVGGWSYRDVPLEGTFKAATATDEQCKQFAENIIDMAKSFGFDGVDMDWEHPRNGEASGQQYAKLMQYLSDGLKQENMLLTVAVLPGKTPDGTVQYDAAAHSDAVIGCVDWINVMAYDGGDGDRHSTYDFAVACAAYWKDTRQVPAHKIVLGVPFYGRPSWAAYSELLKADAGASDRDITSFNGSQVYYNGMNTIRQKTNWALDHLGGVMIWELSQDSSNKEQSLLNAIATAVEAQK